MSENNQPSNNYASDNSNIIPQRKPSRQQTLGYLPTQVEERIASQSQPQEDNIRESDHHIYLNVPIRGRNVHKKKNVIVNKRAPRNRDVDDS